MPIDTKDNDLGHHTLGFEQSYNWKFVPNIFGTTLYFCDVLFDSDPKWYHFDAYVFKRDDIRCNLNNCWWQIIEGRQARQYDGPTGEWIYYNLTPK